MTKLLRLMVPLMLGLAGCVAEYSKSEAPSTLRVEGGESHLTITFATGSDHLTAGETARLNRMVLNGYIRPADRVAIAAGGPPALAQRRDAAVSRELLRYGIVTQSLVLSAVPANQAVVSIGRYAVTLPSCPNWSQSLSTDFTNALTSNFGCANATNLGLMAASPADLLGGRPFSGIDSTPAVNAVHRYLTDTITPPPEPTPSPFSVPVGGAPGAGASGPGSATSP